MIYIGTSGFSYKEWKGIFYPEDLPAKKYLSYYSSQFNTTEINNTFYKIPTPQLTELWAQEVPSDFSFTLKVSQRITHQKKLKGAEEEMERFLQAASALQGKLGTLLVQLPPFARKDAPVLELFLEQNARKARLAFEFRNISWFDEEISGLLKRHNAALAIVETEEQKAFRQITADFLYIRLRKENYDSSDMKDWAKWIGSYKSDVYCYLKHDEKAPVLARQLKDLI